MRLGISLHCGGENQYDCDAQIRTDYTPGWEARLREAAQFGFGGWTIRPIATSDSPDGDDIAFCPRCHKRLLDLAAKAQPRTDIASDPQALGDLLLLVNIAVTPATIARWTDQQREQAREWASREHLSASDNPIRRVPKPEFLP